MILQGLAGKMHLVSVVIQMTEKGDYPMNDAKYLELTCAAVIMTMIILMLALWSEYKFVKVGAIVFACFQGLDLVRVTKQYARKMEEETNSK